jgi:hypothetical protein
LGLLVTLDMTDEVVVIYQVDVHFVEESQVTGISWAQALLVKE